MTNAPGSIRTNFMPMELVNSFSAAQRLATKPTKTNPTIRHRRGMVVSSRLNALNDNLHELTRPLRQRVDPLRGPGPFHHGQEDVLEAQRHRPARERHRGQQLVMVDLAEAGGAVLVLGGVAVVLEAEAA